ECIQEIMDEMERETGGRPSITTKELLEFHQSGNYRFIVNRNASLEAMLTLSPRLADYFNLMDWAVFHAPKNTSFITTDNPVILVPPPWYDPRSLVGYGILTPGVRKVFPLSQTTCLIMYDRGQMLHDQNVDKQIVRSINLQLT